MKKCCIFALLFTIWLYILYKFFAIYLGAVHKLREQQGGRGVFHKCSCLFTWWRGGYLQKFT